MIDITICLPPAKHANAVFKMLLFEGEKYNVILPKMSCSLKLGTVNVEFKNTPFMVTVHVYLHFQFETDYYKERRSNVS